MAKVRFPVEAGHIMTFARALGDDNPVYHDPEYAKASPQGDIIAPPTFTIASAQFDPDYGARPRVGKPWKGSGKEPTGDPDAGKGGGTGLYAEQHFEYHRPIHPGDVLTGEAVPGKEWEKVSQRAGTLKFREATTEWRNQDGELVVTSRKVLVVTSRTVANG
jgi:acyl dehydratase